MALRHSAIGHFVIHKGTVIFLRHLFSFFLQRFEIAAVMMVVNFIVQRHEGRIPFSDIVQDRFLEAAPQVQVFQPEQVALILDTLKYRFKISDARKYGRTKQTVRMPAA